MTEPSGSARSLYADSPDPAAYQQAAGRPKPAAEAAYAPVRLGRREPSRARVLLFTLENYPELGQTFEGSMPDPVPASHYAQFLQDIADYGVTVAEAQMMNRVLGRENMAALSAAPDMQPDDMIKIMSQVLVRTLGPYRDAMGKGQDD
jgi:hypothetical protein